MSEKSLGVYQSVLETIGNTPMIRLNKIFKDCPATIYAKMESHNPGHSTKDRIALYIVEQLERQGKIKPGGSIIESTSGNTGFSLAMVCAYKGYSCILTVPDKSSQEKVNLLRAMGAEVHVCPSNVKPEDNASYYSVAKRLSRDIPNSYYVNQYYNEMNPDAHFFSLAPEIWEQTEQKVTHFISPVGTGGTISGPARFLKAKSQDIQVIGADAYGSALQKFHETGELDPAEIYPYTLEGIGKNIIPSSVHFQFIDRFIKVTDLDATRMARRLAVEEGLMVGQSAGACLAVVAQIAPDLKADDVVVAMIHDHGSRYLSKIFNNEWLLANNLV
jgi:cystathionine beta-synthase